MSEEVSKQPLPAAKSSWPTAAAVVGVVAMVVAGALFFAREVIRAPAGVIHETSRLIDQGGAKLLGVAEAFRRGTVRTEFLSQVTEMTGTSRFQFATLKQAESFQREETGSTAWGWVPLPKVVVLAQAPVEYGYFLDLAAPWEFEQKDDTVMVFVPPITPGTPAMDVSALTFYTLEGGMWRDERATRDRLQQSLTAALNERAARNVGLVREIGRVRVTEFVEKWLAGKFSDGGRFHVKVIFPDERPAAPDPQSL